MKTKSLLLALFSALFVGLNLHSQPSLTNGLTSYYPFNGNAIDVVGGENGTVVNAFLTNNMFGTPTNAYWFSGQISSHISVPAATVDNLNSGTISAWVELDSNTVGNIFAKQHSGSDTMAFFSIGYQWTGTPIIPGQVFFHARNGAPDVFSSTFLSTGIWYHVAAAFSSTNCVIYINGAPSTNVAGNFTIPTDLSPTVTSIGAWWQDGQFACLNGRLSHVRIYNRALSSNDVALLYATESVPPFYFPRNLTNFYAIYGQNTNLSVTATSSITPIGYQWYFLPANNGNQAGAYAQIIGNFVYGAVVTNGGFGYGNIPSVRFTGGGGSGASGYGIVSNGILSAIVITNAGTGYSTLPTVVIDPPDGILFGQTSNTLTISNVDQGNLGNYFVVATNFFGGITSSVVSLTLLYPPTISTNPVGFTQYYHSSPSLSVVAAGTQPLSYQWSLNNTNISGATNSSYVIASLTPSSIGAYVVQVTNLYGLVYSSPAYVYLIPALTSPFTGAVGLWGQDTTLEVGAVGSGLLSYQWYFNGTAISDATSNIFVLNNIQFTNAGLYSVVVSSPYGSVTNNAYQVVVNLAIVSLGTFPGVYITGTVGNSYTIQSCTNLADTNAWVTLTNLAIPTSSYIWVDSSTDTSLPANPKKFYRVVANP